MKPLLSALLPEYTQTTARVTSWSTVNIARTVYSVPSRLIGETLKVRQYEERLEIWYGGARQETIPRIPGRQHQINYRNIIDWLIRKPGAFMNYRYRTDLFPDLRLRQAYDRLSRNVVPTLNICASSSTPPATGCSNTSPFKNSTSPRCRNWMSSSRNLISCGEESCMINTDLALPLMLKQLRLGALRPGPTSRNRRLELSPLSAGSLRNRTRRTTAPADRTQPKTIPTPLPTRFGKTIRLWSSRK